MALCNRADVWQLATRCRFDIAKDLEGAELGKGELANRLSTIRKHPLNAALHAVRPKSPDTPKTRIVQSRGSAGRRTLILQGRTRR